MPVTEGVVVGLCLTKHRLETLGSLSQCFPYDGYHGFVVGDHINMASICVVVELLQTMYSSQHLLFDLCVVPVSARKGAACKRHRSAFLCQNAAHPVVTCIIHHCELLVRVIECKHGAVDDHPFHSLERVFL